MAEAATRRTDAPELEFVAGDPADNLADDRAIPLDDETSEPLVVGASAAHSAKRETLEPGRSLVVADFSDPAHSVAERLIRLAYGFGIPASTLTSPERCISAGP